MAGGYRWGEWDTKEEESRSDDCMGNAWSSCSGITSVSKKKNLRIAHFMNISCNLIQILQNLRFEKALHLCKTWIQEDKTSKNRLPYRIWTLVRVFWSEMDFQPWGSWNHAEKLPSWIWKENCVLLRVLLKCHYLLRSLVSVLVTVLSIPFTHRTTSESVLRRTFTGLNRREGSGYWERRD